MLLVRQGRTPKISWRRIFSLLRSTRGTVLAQTQSRVLAQLVGEWRADRYLSLDLNASSVYTFHPDGRYQYSLLFQGKTMRKSSNIEAGTFSVHGNRLTLNGEGVAYQGKHVHNGELLQQRQPRLKTRVYYWQVGVNPSGVTTLWLTSPSGEETELHRQE
jgi:hypothetical protein